MKKIVIMNNNENNEWIMIDNDEMNEIIIIMIK